MIRSTRFVRQFLRPAPSRLESRDITYRRGEQTFPASLYHPSGLSERDRRRLPAWIVLHGLTYTGRAHPTLQRFAASVAASGAVVLVPEVPEWRELDVAPGATGPTIDGALDALEAMGHVGPGVMGFSFGATQTLNAVAEPARAARLAAVVAWGGYCDVGNLFRFGLTGEHGLDGEEFHIDPDPYGRWVMGANYLTRIPGLEAREPTAAALMRLAQESGRLGIYAWEPDYDPLKAELRAGLSAADREIFDLFAPPTTRPLDDKQYEAALELSAELALAASRAEPLLDPRPRLTEVRVPTRLAHGRDDRLVPFTESVRLQRALAPDCGADCTITSLFAHSGGSTEGSGLIVRARETASFLAMLQRILKLV